jgi:hypothetical protein
MDDHDARQALAVRLRTLREGHWPGVKVTQPQLARALGGDKGALSVPLISSWESATNPKIPPLPRLEAYASFFATSRSLDGEMPRLLRPDELTGDERLSRQQLRTELMRLRNDALRATDPADPAPARAGTQSLDTGPWRFAERSTLTIVCAQLPREMLRAMPYTDPDDPDYIALYTYADLDALFELHGHVRAANPASQVNLRAAKVLAPDDYTGHLVALGGVDWNEATRSVLELLQLPVAQVADWDSPDGPYFEVAENGQATRHRPIVEKSSKNRILREDVALFARAVNPFNRQCTVTICNGMYGSGSFGAVRALTDARFRERNAEYLQARFGDCEAFCILTRVLVYKGAALTPDWTIAHNRLFEWSRPRDVD